MTPRAITARLAEPLTDTPVTLALLLFWAFGAFAWLLFDRFLLVSPLASMLALVLVLCFALPACLRYLLSLLEARVLKRETPVLTIAHFNPVDGTWRLAPLLLVAVVVGLYAALDGFWPAATPLLPALVGVLLMPLVLTELAVTHSIAAAFNPVAWWRLLARLGPRCAVVPVVFAGSLALLEAGRAAGIAPPWLIAAGLYLLAFGTLLTGRVVGARVGRDDIDIPASIPLADDDERAERRRQQVLNHAYGFVSRGNREGGFAHIDDCVTASDAPLATERWFFDAMLGWENRDAALFYAQRHLHHLLEAGHEIEAMKLIARCLLENPRFVPAEGDRERAIAAAERLGNAEIGTALRRS